MKIKIENTNIGCHIYSGDSIVEERDSWSCSGAGAKYYVEFPYPILGTDGRYSLVITMVDMLGNTKEYDLPVEAISDSTSPFIANENEGVDKGYYMIESSNRYNYSGGSYTQNNNGNYLKVNDEYYEITASNRYNYVNEQYVQNDTGVFLRITVYDAVLIYPLGGGKINNMATVLIALVFNERLDQNLNNLIEDGTVSLPDLYIRFARGTSFVTIRRIPGTKDNVKIVGKSIVYKYQLVVEDNGDLELSPYIQYDPEIKFEFIWDKDDTNLDVVKDVFGNSYQGSKDENGTYRSQIIAAIQPPAFITGDTRATYIRNITLEKEDEGYYHYKEGDVVNLKL